jgi:anaerobic magnesium-protoporphyrin IX monomethyl ester cyclase
MTIVFINPNLLVQRNDPFTTGIIYMPIGLAYVVASVRCAGFNVSVVDSFGLSPKSGRVDGKFMYLGLTNSKIIELLPSGSSLICLYANQLINHSSLISILESIKAALPNIPVLILENTQAVTAYDLRAVASDLFQSGADFIMTGEAELRLPNFIERLLSGESIDGCDGLYGSGFMNPATTVIDNLDDLPFPAWDLFPLENYWNLGIAHGPLSSSRYLPILSSRGCPYPCKFCVVPATNFLKWRARSPKNVVDEMEFYKQRFNVDEFHFEDLDSTVNDKRTNLLCSELIERKLNIVWKIVAGTKVETMRNEETIINMANSGCRYISISPESGSPRMLKLMAKPFKVDHAVSLIRQMNKVGIKSQACFVLGFPGEEDGDRLMSKKLLKQLVIEGLDEVAIFIISPVPGSAIFSEIVGFKNLSDLSFTPSWRNDYLTLNSFRKELYTKFLLWKCYHYPWKILKQCINFIKRRFETKMEMVPYKALVWKVVELLSKKVN